MSLDTINVRTPEEVFSWWSELHTPATSGTTFEDWEASVYRDAWCFTRRDRSDCEAFMIRGASLINFGWEDDTLESAYEMLSVSVRRFASRPRAARRRHLH